MQIDTIELRQTGWGHKQLGPGAPARDKGFLWREQDGWRPRGYSRGRGPCVPKPAGVGIRARRPAVRLELMDHRWWRSTKAALCLAPMCSHPSEGSLRGVDECAGEERQAPR